ncbi:hypothetical protein L873DRAFT_1791283 [Choiromyces venosus 120613-1]|uniref:Uncharacterized protein n=1 Tax=Choiromyces venosus 120613-1 TaxID=1336337 RepID=A0A3N4JKR4_9PEZI|nr:hypothetical protein L873DRAFT_1791283 [Choiromyces venosus 120613-1]
MAKTKVTPVIEYQRPKRNLSDRAAPSLSQEGAPAPTVPAQPASSTRQAATQRALLVPASASFRRSDSLKLDSDGNPTVPLRYDDPISKSKYYLGKTFSTGPARATDKEIESDLAAMRMSVDGEPFVLPGSAEKKVPVELNDQKTPIFTGNENK